jgi:molecular chaperone GrpE (heat shock protein)
MTPQKKSREEQADEQALSELEERVALVEKERDEYLNDLRRVAADFDNYRKRTARVQVSLVARALERVG